MRSRVGLLLICLGVFLLLGCVWWAFGHWRDTQEQALATDLRKSKQEGASVEGIAPPVRELQAHGTDDVKKGLSALPNQTQGVITVVSKDYQPEVGATVSIWNGVRYVNEGLTGSSGTITVNWPDADATEVYAEKVGASGDTVTILSPFPSELTMVLLPEGELHGTIRSLDGSPVGQGVRVLAIPREMQFPTVSFFSHACRGDASANTASTDGAGQYSIRGLSSGHAYSLIARGEGMSTFGLVGPYSAGDVEPHDLTVRAMYYLGLELYDSQTSKPLELSPWFAFGVDLGISVGGTDLKFTNVTPNTLRFLANCAEPEPIRSWQVDEYFLGESGDKEDGPVSVTIELPGYEPWAGALKATRLGDGSRRRVTLKRVASGFGSLIVRLPPSMRQKATQGGLPPASLTVQPESGDGLDFRIDAAESGEVRCDGIPFGPCSCTISGSPQGMFYPAPGEPAFKAIISDHPSVFEIPEGHSGTLILDPRRPDGSGYAGYLDVMVMFGVAPGNNIKGFRAPGGIRTFAGPPYRIDALSPGDHTVVLRCPLGIEKVVTCSVSASEPATCILQVP